MGSSAVHQLPVIIHQGCVHTQIRFGTTFKSGSNSHADVICFFLKSDLSLYWLLTHVGIQPGFCITKTNVTVESSPRHPEILDKTWFTSQSHHSGIKLGIHTLLRAEAVAVTPQTDIMVINMISFSSFFSCPPSASTFACFRCTTFIKNEITHVASMSLFNSTHRAPLVTSR